MVGIGLTNSEITESKDFLTDDYEEEYNPYRIDWQKTVKGISVNLEMII
jgi:hypothetical protein